MTGPWIKICGLTREEDALAAVACGARALGFILHPESPRFIEPERAAEIIERLPGPVAKVAVTVDAPAEMVWDLKLRYHFTAVQAHGAESPAECGQYPLPVVKAVRCAPGLELQDLSPYRGMPILLDGYTQGVHGGTGRLADWELALRLKEEGHRVLLAGGLGPHNVREAVAAVGPAAVDFNSQVESSPGVKDHQKLQELGRLMRSLGSPERESWPW